MSHRTQFPSLRPVAKPVTATPAMQTSIAGNQDAMRTGLTNVRTQIAERHPMEVMQTEQRGNETRLHMAVVQSAQGHPAAMAMQMERSILSQRNRLPHLHQSNLAMEISLGLDSSMDFEDYLNDPSEPEVLGNVHAMMEASPQFFR